MRYNRLSLFSGGKDSLAMAHIMQDVSDGVLFCKTGVGLMENFNFVKDVCQDYGWPLYIVEPKECETYEDFVRKFGFPQQGMHSAVMGYLKMHPMRKFAREHKGVIYNSGRRLYESNERKNRKMKKMRPWDNRDKPMFFVAPLFYWTDGDVRAYYKKEELPTCPVYETMEMSGDCLCGAYSELGEAELLKTFHPSLADQLEYLEKKYGGTWGRQTSIQGAKKQSDITSFICSQECSIRRNF